METDRRPVTESNAPIVYSRRGPRWVPAHSRQSPTDDDGNPPKSASYGPNLNFRSRVATTLESQIRQQRFDIHHQIKEVSRMNRDRFTVSACSKDEIVSKRPQFRAIYLEFENMKNMGLVVNAEQKPERFTQHDATGHPQYEMGRKQRNPRGDFAEAMKIFMKSYLPTSSSLGCAKPVDDWSKEAGNLLIELTENERSPLDLDNSVWNIPSGTRPITTGPTTYHSCSENSMSATALQSSESEFGGVRFDIHRHIKDIKPSPYPGGSPLSSRRSSSSHSSDNDADDECAQSFSESTCSKTIGAKKSLKNRFDLSLTCSPLDSGYLSSATESDGAKPVGMSMRRVPGGSVNSDDFSSECGFTSFACVSWPSSPPPSKAAPLPDCSRKGHWSDESYSKVLSNAAEMSSPQSAFQKLRKVSLPMPPFLSGITEIPLPPPPHILPSPSTFLPVVSVAQLPPTTMSSFPSAISALPRIALVGTLPSLSYASHLEPAKATELIIREGLSVHGTYHKHKAWITDEILEMIAVRDRLYKRMKRHPAPEIVEMYKKVRNMVVGMTRNAKRSYEKHLEEQQMEKQLRDSRLVKNLNSLNSLSIRFPQKLCCTDLV